MIPLKTNRRVLTWLCICRPDNSTSERKRMLYTIFGTAVFIQCIGSLILDIIFLSKSLHVDLELSYYILFQIGASSNRTNAVITGLLIRDKINAMFDNLTKIYETHENDENSSRLLARATTRSENMWRRYFKYVMGFFAVSTTFNTVMALCSVWMATGGFDVDLVYHPYKFDLPWNQETFLGYIGEILYSLFGGGFYLYANGSFLLLFISIYFHHWAFTEIFKQSLEQRVNSKSVDRQFMCKLIQFSITAKDLFKESMEIYSVYLLILLVCTMGFMACSVFLFDLQLQNPDSDFLTLIIAILCGFANLFLFCFFGKKTTDIYANNADGLYESNWQEWPVEQQKYIKMMISNAQIPLRYVASGLVVMNLETFQKCLKIVYTYYMLLKTVAAD